MIKTKTWIVIFSVLLLVCILATLFLYTRQPDEMIVQVLQDGVCIRQIDLSKVKTAYSFVVEDVQGGSNTICVEPGRICITDADCPDQICVRRGWLSGSAEPIVCLPHKLVIQLAGSAELDSVAQ